MKGRTGTMVLGWLSRPSSMETVDKRSEVNHRRLAVMTPRNAANLNVLTGDGKAERFRLSSGGFSRGSISHIGTKVSKPSM